MHTGTHDIFTGRDRHADRINQERHVVGDDLDYGMTGFPTLVVFARVEHPHTGRFGLAHLQEVKNPADQGSPARYRAQAHVLVGYPLEK